MENFNIANGLFLKAKVTQFCWLLTSPFEVDIHLYVSWSLLQFPRFHLERFHIYLLSLYPLHVLESVQRSLGIFVALHAISVFQNRVYSIWFMYRVFEFRIELDAAMLFCISIMFEVRTLQQLR
jgi:hypothetical protein